METSIFWEYPFLYKIEIFIQNDRFFSKVEDIKRNSSLISSIFGLSNRLFYRLHELSTICLQRFFSVNSSTLELVYNPGLNGGGCADSRPGPELLETSQGENAEEPLKKLRAQYIEVKNDGAYEMCFHLEDENGYQSESSDCLEAWGTGTKVIDLASTSFAVGTQVTIIINALLGVKSAAAQRIQFHLNNRTVSFVAKGTTNCPIAKFKEIKEPETKPKTPKEWPPGIFVYKVPFHSWDNTFVTPDLWTCAPRDEEEALAACNWAAKNDYHVRPRGVMHNWSPLSINSTDYENNNILFLDTTKYLRTAIFISDSILGPRVSAGAGLTLGELMSQLELAPGDSASASGWSFPHIPATSHLTIGGLLAINGHGSAIPNQRENWTVNYGSMSNHILQIRAIVTDPSNPNEYVLRNFNRGEPDTKAFLTSLGRILIIDATLRVIPNYNLRCISTMKIGWNTLCAPQPEDDSSPENSISKFLEDTGRIEMIWFPFSEEPWLKIWSHYETQPTESRKVGRSNNYTFTNHLPSYITDLVNELKTNGEKTRYFCKHMASICKFGLKETKTKDIWGLSKNILLYIKDQTLRFITNGYAIQIQRKDVQKAVHLIANKYHSMLLDYESNKKYPINLPLEIRLTSLDDSKFIPVNNGFDPSRPLLSAISADSISEANHWDVVIWVNVLTLPGTPDSNEFFTEIEEWLLETFNGEFARVRPEWSKGWAYTKNEGPWHNEKFLDYLRQSFTAGHDESDTWHWENATFNGYDAKKIYHSDFNDKLFIV